MANLHQNNLYSRETAERIAAELTSEDEDGWRYTAKHDPTGKGLSLVEIFDEKGEFVGYF